jgi:hypothetical protein
MHILVWLQERNKESKFCPIFRMSHQKTSFWVLSVISAATNQRTKRQMLEVSAALLNIRHAEKTNLAHESNQLSRLQ